ILIRSARTGSKTFPSSVPSSAGRRCIGRDAMNSAAMFEELSPARPSRLRDGFRPRLRLCGRPGRRGLCVARFLRACEVELHVAGAVTKRKGTEALNGLVAELGTEQGGCAIMAHAHARDCRRYLRPRLHPLLAAGRHSHPGGKRLPRTAFLAGG